MNLISLKNPIDGLKHVLSKMVFEGASDRDMVPKSGSCLEFVDKVEDALVDPHVKRDINYIENDSNNILDINREDTLRLKVRSPNILVYMSGGVMSSSGDIEPAGIVKFIIDEDGILFAIVFEAE